MLKYFIQHPPLVGIARRNSELTQTAGVVNIVPTGEGP